MMKMIIIEFKDEIMKTFEMIDVRLMQHFLRIKGRQSDDEILILQKKFIESLIKVFKISGCKIFATPLDKIKALKKDGLPKVDNS